MAHPEFPSLSPESLSREVTTIGRFKRISVGGIINPERDNLPLVGQQTLILLTRIGNALGQEGAGKDHIYRNNIIIRNPADFKDLNSIYGSWFGRYDKPSRFTTVGKFDDPKILVRIDSMTIVPNEPGAEVIIENINTAKAPAAVGPYAQGKRINLDIDTGDETKETIITSGQIALDPQAESPTLVSTDFGEQATQTFANVQAILEEGRTEDISGIEAVLTAEEDREAFLAHYDQWATAYDKTLPEPVITIGALLLDAKIEVSAVGKRNKSEVTLFQRT